MTETTHQIPVPPQARADRPTLTGQDIAEAQGALRAVLEKNMAKAGSSADAYIVLRVLAVRGPMGSSADFHAFLAGQRQLGLDRPAVATLLGGLEADGLITGSAVDDPGPVQLTQQGAARHTNLAALTIPITKQIFGDLDPDDLAVAHQVLVRITERAQSVREAI
jgi:DNA-binding MarR family transcriptional regulator